MKKFLLFGLMSLILSITVSGQLFEQDFSGTWNTAPSAPGQSAYYVDQLYVSNGTKQQVPNSNPANFAAYFSGEGYVRTPNLNGSLISSIHLKAFNTSSSSSSFTVYLSVNETEWLFASTLTVGANSSKTTTLSWGGAKPKRIKIVHEAGDSPLFLSQFNYTVVAGPLPIELTSFSASQKNRQVALNWETSSETNNDFFTIERSMDGRLFAQIGYVQGVGNSEFAQKYSFIDKNPKRGTNYYRLSQTDVDGHTETFDITTTDVVIGQTSINPTTVTDYMTLNFEPSRSAGLVSIFNLTGQQVYDAAVEPETTTLEINAAIFPKGQYFARLSFGGEIQTVRFLKY